MFLLGPVRVKLPLGLLRYINLSLEKSLLEDEADTQRKAGGEVDANQPLVSSLESLG